MASHSSETISQNTLRERAHARLTEHRGVLGDGLGQSTSSALRVLYDLAASPETAADALTLLHELQVHQVELDLQAEELRVSRNDLETALARQVQIYECLPVAVFTIDRDTVLHEVNLTGAQRLMMDREKLLEQRLDAFLAPYSSAALQAALRNIDQGSEQASFELTLKPEPSKGSTPAALAAINVDPECHRYFLVCTDLPPQQLNGS